MLGVFVEAEVTNDELEDCLALAGKGKGNTCDTSEACLQTNFCISRTIMLDVCSICLMADSLEPTSLLSSKTPSASSSSCPRPASSLSKIGGKIRGKELDLFRNKSEVVAITEAEAVGEAASLSTVSSKSSGTVDVERSTDEVPGVLLRIPRNNGTLPSLFDLTDGLNDDVVIFNSDSSSKDIVLVRLAAEW